MRAFRSSFVNDILICTFLPSFPFYLSSWIHQQSFLHKSMLACVEQVINYKKTYCSSADRVLGITIVMTEHKQLSHYYGCNASIFLCLFFFFFQFYKCFLILFHCGHWSGDNGNTSMPSKTTAIQLNRRVYSNTVACADHLSTVALKQCCSTDAISTKNTSTIEGKLWTLRKRLGPVLWGPWTKPLYINVLDVWRDACEGGNIPCARFVFLTFHMTCLPQVSVWHPNKEVKGMRSGSSPTPPIF